MIVKTCEEYVLGELENAQNRIAELEEENEDLKRKCDNLTEINKAFENFANSLEQMKYNNEIIPNVYRTDDNYNKCNYKEIEVK